MLTTVIEAGDVNLELSGPSEVSRDIQWHHVLSLKLALVVSWCPDVAGSASAVPPQD